MAVKVRKTKTEEAEITQALDAFGTTKDEIRKGIELFSVRSEWIEVIGGDLGVTLDKESGLSEEGRQNLQEALEVVNCILHYGVFKDSGEYIPRNNSNVVKLLMKDVKNVVVDSIDKQLDKIVSGYVGKWRAIQQQGQQQANNVVPKMQSQQPPFGN